MSKQLPRAVRNNNPGNIEHVASNKWLGILPKEKRNPEQLAETRFEVFESGVYGFRAMALLFQKYQDKYGCNTVEKMINKWAPNFENNTDAYVKAVAAKVKVRADDVIDVHQYDYAFPLLKAVAEHETGSGYKWPDNQIVEGLRRAGVVPNRATVAKVPVTKETVAASGVGSLGIAQFADVAPQVSDAVTQANYTMSGGTWVQIIMGALTLGLAIYIAYSQVKKHQAGLE